MITEFKVGEIYTNDQIRFALKLENMGGIRPSLDSNKKLSHLAVMTTDEGAKRRLSENPYQDRIEGDVLLYTAEGREGDQQLSGKNKRLIEQYNVPLPFYGFANIGQMRYRFLGLLELLRHYQEMQVDKGGKLRNVWLFEFHIHKDFEIAPIEQAATLSASLIAESRQSNPLAELEREVAELNDEEPQSADPAVSQTLESIRSQLMQVTPYRFEHLIKELMEVNGFTNVTVTSASGDGGIDVNAFVDEKNDFFAGTHVQAQVKRWRHAVGSVEINKFRGALSVTAKGVFISTSHYTRAAILEARHQFKPCITLIDGGKLSSLISQSDVNVSNFL